MSATLPRADVPEPWAILAAACRRAIDGLALENDPALRVWVNPADMPGGATSGAVVGVPLVVTPCQEAGYVRAVGVHRRFQERIQHPPSSEVTFAPCEMCGRSGANVCTHGLPE